MNKHAVLHLTEPPYAYGIDKDNLVVRIRTAKDDMKKVSVFYKDRYDFQGEYIELLMDKKETTELFNYYEATLNVFERRFRYYFKLEDQQGEVILFNENGFMEKVPEENWKYTFNFPYLCDGDIYEDVKWAKEGVVYQIFPDRFNNGDKTNDPKGTLPWGGEVTTYSTFGGDLKGITKKLDYLKDLGVTIIYSTPIFKSTSNHKYNTEDYYEIDPQFGDKEVFKELVKEAHKRGMRVILDAVFNHTGNDFFAFKDLIKNGEKSKYKDWYYAHSYPIDREKVNYRTFATGISEMPKINTSVKEAKDYLLDVAEHWIREYDIDGWRLDVCDEVDHNFWREFRKRVKSIKKDALIIGEIMHEANSFLKGDQLDSIMNYPFKGALTDFFAKGEITGEIFFDNLVTTQAMYMKNINFHMFNLIDSHDTARFLTEADGDKRRLMLAVAFQFSYIGIPYIYYGDEVGIDGGNDPDCRKCMIWDEEKQDKELLSFFKRVATIRKENKTLVYGDVEFVSYDNNVVVMKRISESEEYICIFNNNLEYINVELSGSYTELYNEQLLNIEKELRLEPLGFKILKKVESM